MNKRPIDTARFSDTGYSYTLSLIAGKYKPIILYCLMEYEPVRFNEMQRYLGRVADKTLSRNLKELEADGLIHREMYPEVPPRVEYTLTARGHSLVTVLDELYNVIQDRQLHPVEGSYTNYLFKNGQDKILKKVGEEAAETIIASKNMSREEIIYEMGDLWYHCMVLLAFHNIAPDALFAELMNRRHGGKYHKFEGKTGIRPEM